MTSRTPRVWFGLLQPATDTLFSSALFVSDRQRRQSTTKTSGSSAFSSRDLLPRNSRRTLLKVPTYLKVPYPPYTLDSLLIPTSPLGLSPS